MFQKRRATASVSSEDIVNRLIQVSDDSRIPKNTVSTKDLVENKAYTVTLIRGLKTAYGSKVMLELDSKFHYFLPERYSKLLPKVEDQLNTVPENLTMFYRGRGVENAVLLEFIKHDFEEDD